MKRKTPFAPEFPDVIELGRSAHHEWVESTAPFTHQHAQVQFLGTSISRKKISLLFACVVVILIVFLVKSALFQIFSGKDFARLAFKNKVKTITVSARRGILYDRNATPLVENIPRFVLQVNPAELPRGADARTKELDELAAISGLPADTIRTKASEHTVADPLVLNDEIDYADALNIIVKTAQMPGVEVLLRDRRNYLFSDVSSLSHVLGHMGIISQNEYARESDTYRPTDSIGKDGVEAQYEQELRGVDGKKEIEVDALGAEKRIVSQDDPRDGKSIILSIDKNLQEVAERSLQNVFETSNTKRGVVLVSNPRTGEILAMVSLPSFDNNIFSKKISPDDYNKLFNNENHPLYNRAIQGEYPSGSTIKPIVAAAAVQEKIVTPETSFPSTGGLRVGEWFFPDWKAGGHGRTNVIKALAESVNTYFYIVAGGYNSFTGLGARKLLSYYHLFGVDKKTGIDLPGEHTGFVPSPEWKRERTGESWYIGDTYHIAIGQGDVLVTPLFIHMMTEYFANGGWAATPRLFHSFVGSDTPAVKADSYWLKAGLDPATIAVVRAGLREVVLTGSGRRLSSLPVTAAGKTGTAQWKTTAPPHAWFTGWAPFDNPEVVVTVLVEEGQEGSRTAIAVADEVLRWYFTVHHRETGGSGTRAAGQK